MSKLNLINFLIIIIIIIIIILISNHLLHPITIISLILIYTRFTCIIITLWSFNYIYSIIIFLIIIRGILILFLYFASLISNEQHKILLNWTIPIKLILILTILSKFKFLFESPQQSHDIKSQINLKNHSLQYTFKLFDYPFNYITIICILFLLISLLLIIKIRSLKSAPLRKII